MRSTDTHVRHSGSKINPNPFVETTLSYALTYVSRVGKHRPSHSMTSAKLVILADNDYYSHPDSPSTNTRATQRFARFPTTLSGANKTGLGSSAALVTALTAALLTHYLPLSLFDISTTAGRHTLHNLAQAAHCAAQGKVGSGFDVAAAVFGSCLYRRFSPSVLSELPEPGAPGFAPALVSLVDSREKWDVEVEKDGVSISPGLALRMCDVDCGSQTVGMVKKVLEWRARDRDASKKLWDELQARNEALAFVLREGRQEDISAAVGAVRALIREMSASSGVPIEPESQTELLDAVSLLEGVFGGVVPGAGGYDALALLMKDDEATKQMVETFLAEWSKKKGGKVRLLRVKGEMEGVRLEKLSVYDGWLPLK
jgi:phosphomevalonate kinase